MEGVPPGLSGADPAALLRGVGAEGIALVSSDSHIDRAMGNFRSAAPGLQLYPVGVPGW